MAKKLVHIGFTYHITLPEEGAEVPFLFENKEEALTYAKENCGSISFCIVPLPLFRYLEQN